jgi:hypothetical protein
MRFMHHNSKYYFQKNQNKSNIYLSIYPEKHSIRDKSHHQKTQGIACGQAQASFG